MPGSGIRAYYRPRKNTRAGGRPRSSRLVHLCGSNNKGNSLILYSSKPTSSGQSPVSLPSRRRRSPRGRLFWLSCESLGFRVFSDQTDDRVRNKTEPGVMLEMCYVPRPWTDLAKLFKTNGWKVVTGDQAMIWQGIEVRDDAVSMLALIS